MANGICCPKWDMLCWCESASIIPGELWTDHDYGPATAGNSFEAVKYKTMRCRPLQTASWHCQKIILAYCQRQKYGWLPNVIQFCLYLSWAGKLPLLSFMMNGKKNLYSVFYAILMMSLAGGFIVVCFSLLPLSEDNSKI